MDAHLGYSLAYRLAIAKIAGLGSADAFEDAGLADIVSEARQPSVEFSGAIEGVHVLNCIRSDTYCQAEPSDGCMSARFAALHLLIFFTSSYFIDHPGPAC
jgi:hypothetical protein